MVDRGGSWYRVTRVEASDEDRRPITRPSRWCVLAGAVVLLVDLPFPWGKTDVGAITTIFSAFHGSFDGLTAFVLAVCLLVLSASKTVAGTRMRALQLLPAVLGAVSALVVLDGYQATQIAVSGAIETGGTGEIYPSLYAALAGAALTLVGGVAVTASMLKNGASADPSVQPEVRGLEAQATRVLVVGGVTGVVLAVVLVVALHGNALTVLLVPAALLLSPVVVERAWRAIFHPARRAR